MRLTTCTVLKNNIIYRYRFRADEQDWSHAQKPKTLYSMPVDTGSPKHETIVKMLCDDTNLYLLAICCDDQQYVTPDSQKEMALAIVMICITPGSCGKKNNGFGFGVNAMNAQKEVLFSTNEPDISLGQQMVFSSS
ncbi:MAG: hypothetical protein IPJ13_10245 [Saprospiraceae bacterium]|nr:hypothetical protein [Saprospiraceae bacterium]